MREGDLGSLLKCGASVVALCAFVAAAPALAQPTGTTTPAGPGTAGNTANSSEEGAQTRVADATEPAADEGGDAIVVTGFRQSLANSQNIKRNADTVVDAITAQDIGALPDRSVTEALQRVPGVAMNRFAGSNDPDHFSVEGSGVVVRGLSFVRSEFNGRDTFSAGVYGQAINFSDVPSELLGSVEVYKNATAEMIEGGLSGTVNLNTRKPLDNKGFHLGFDAELNYGDMAKHYTPTGSLLVSNTWETGIGTIGLLGDISYSRLKSRSDGIQVTNFQTRAESGTDLDINGNVINRHGLPGSADADHDGFADPLPLAYAPVGGQFRSQDYDRSRKGFAVAAQWESLDRRSELTAQFLRTDSTNRWGEHTFESAPDLSLYNTYPRGCQQNGNGAGGTTRPECPVGGFQNYQYDENGVFESGFITLPGTGWRTASSGDPATNVPTGGIQQSLSRREVDDRNIVSDYGLNFKFRPSDRWAINLDGDYTKARHDTLDMSVFGSTFADQELDISGNIPQLINHKPLTLAASWATPNPRIVGENDQQYFADRNVQFWRAAMDHIEHSEGQEWAFKGDVVYDFMDDVPFLKRVKFGARYADRDQTVRYTTYNWGAISEVWSGTPVSFAQSPANSSLYSFDNFFRGKTPGPPDAYYYDLSLIQGYNAASQYFKSINDIWHTTNGATAANRWVPAGERPGVVAGTPFLPSEIQHVSETNKNAYLMLSFGQDEPLFGGIRVDGNIGVRYVNTRLESVGAFTIPNQTTIGVTQPFSVRCAVQPPPPGAPPGTPPSTPGGICTIGEAAYNQVRQFATGANAPNTAVNKYDYFLPSLNIKFGLTRDLILRFAGSRALARPSQADVRNFIDIGTDTTNGFRLSATAGNPFLKPALSDQFDVSLEWYFARVGSLTFDAFYKKIHNFFYQNVTQRPVTNNGVTQLVAVRGPDNFNGSGTVKGFEIAYQQTFDFLPGFLSGLGVNANYSHIVSKGLPNSFLNGGAPANTSQASLGNLPLEQLSKHNFNITGFYEKGPISLRASYNWRSRFLLTAADVIYPYYPIFNDATGQLDASAFFSVTKQIKVGVQAVNILNEITKTSQQFTQSGLIGPRSYFMNDRRFSFMVRGTF
ncbi:MAG: TonB-dependent receptor [Alphaproteobacteria bacterium]|nr:TonB-dependent receptor [Alphaproteobacteria bacterium]MBV9370112.1 TonB-dependent receptor [Alphaproteobacteria bacterium]MBV9901452.1 TonB-dependent receptor [Alphaproteobacteria bacterium]